MVERRPLLLPEPLSRVAEFIQVATSSPSSTIACPVTCTYMCSQIHTCCPTLCPRPRAAGTGGLTATASWRVAVPSRGPSPFQGWAGPRTRVRGSHRAVVAEGQWQGQRERGGNKASQGGLKTRGHTWPVVSAEWKDRASQPWEGAGFMAVGCGLICHLQAALGSPTAQPAEG